MIKLPSQTTFASLEDVLRNIHQSPGQDLRLPAQIRYGGSFSFASVAVQCIATWARLHEGRRRVRLATNFLNDEKNQARISGSLISMCGLYFAQDVVAGDSFVPRNKALEAVTPRVFAMQDYEYQKTLRGPSVALCCFEGAKLEFLNPLYVIPERGTSETTTIRSVSDFASILPQMLDACSANASLALTNSQTLALAQLIHQLFKNADVHAATDVHGNFYDTGMRGIQVREVRIADESIRAAFVSDDHALLAYLAKVGRRNVVRTQDGLSKSTTLQAWPYSRFIEITVFDTGPGLALRWLALKKGITRYAEVNRSDELEAVKECFKLHATTHSGGMKGDGLPIAISAMRELKAFMFLRTGRLALFQDFSSGTHTTFLPKQRYGTKQLAEAVGASYSICFPL